MVILPFLLLIPWASAEIDIKLRVYADVVKRIFPHADKDDLQKLVTDLNSQNVTAVRKQLVLDFVDSRFGVKRSRTESPFDDKEYALHKMWSLLDQRVAVYNFLTFTYNKWYNTISPALIKELDQIFFILDERYYHLFPATVRSFSETITLTFGDFETLNIGKVLEDEFRPNHTEDYFHLQYWQLYDYHIEFNVLFL